MSTLNRESGIQSIPHLREKIARLQARRAELGKSGAFDVVIGPKVRLAGKTRAAAEAYLEALGELAATGVTWASFDPDHPSRAAWLENLQWFAEEVIARA
jgi:alkanesulfonate monooxygenase SsuD/methylene tetrahydromethanopterin reductase-like flavin-dependent oxidoreductase (luciferase family)